MSDEALGEALFNLSARLASSGFLDDADNHAAYEKVVAAFNAPPFDSGEVRAKALEEAARVADRYVAMTRESPYWEERTSKCLEAIGERIRALISSPVAPDGESTGITLEEGRK